VRKQSLPRSKLSACSMNNETRGFLWFIRFALDKSPKLAEIWRTEEERMLSENEVDVGGLNGFDY
jgi:hypothetical protein